MRAAATLNDYLAQPIGQYLRLHTCASWWSSERLNGISFWGRPEEAHIQQLALALDAELAPGVKAHASVVDARRVHAVDLSAFEALARYVGANRDALARVVTRQAIVRPEGFAGAVVAGFYAATKPVYPVAVFTDPRDALDWVGAQDDASVVGDLATICDGAADRLAWLAKLRSHLERTPTATLKEAARALGMSSRSLQRKLREAHATYKGEQNSAQLRMAKALLRETDYNLKRIAIEVGCASLPNFSVLFRRLVGQAPANGALRFAPRSKSPG